jgi:integrase/recombinase XerD
VITYQYQPALSVSDKFIAIEIRFLQDWIFTDGNIFRTTKNRNRLLLQLMARGGMRVGEVLKLRLKDLQDQKLILQATKSGKEQEIVFIPQKVADRLRDYAHHV